MNFCDGFAINVFGNEEIAFVSEIVINDAVAETIVVHRVSPSF